MGIIIIMLMDAFYSVPQIWHEMFEPMHCLNFSIGGDQTQHLLWRINNGEVDFVDPKVTVS